MTAKQQGFTLVELVVLIVIFGILAAIAVPRSISFTKDARVAALNGVAGATRSAASLVQARWVASGSTGTSVTLADASTVTVTGIGANAGLPISDTNGIGKAVTISGFAYTVGVASGTFNFAPDARTNCNVTYTPAAVVTVVSTGC